MKKKKGVKNEKKNGADTEIGYCPFEHKAGRAGRALGARALGELGVGGRHGGRRRVAWRAAQRAGARAQPCDTTDWAATTLPLRAPGRDCAHLGVLARLCVCTLCT